MVAILVYKTTAKLKSYTYSYKGPTWVSSDPSANGAEDSSHTARLRTNLSLELDWEKTNNIYIPLADIQKAFGWMMDIFFGSVAASIK